MRSVCVVGGGPAGARAALAAVELGAKASLLERLPSLPLPGHQWSSLLNRGEALNHDTHSLLVSAGVEVECGTNVTAVDGDCRVVASERRRRFDSVVIASGTDPAPPAALLKDRKGLFVADGAEAYVEVRDRSPGFSRSAVIGSGPDAADVADWMSKGGMRVTWYPGEGLLGPRYSSLARSTVEGAAAEREIRVDLARPHKIVGRERVEAVLAGGSVNPCECVVVVPDRTLRPPAVPFRAGPHGGLMVDPMMRSASPGIFAAGDCAEFRVGNTWRPAMIPSFERASGRVAGSNAAHGTMTLRPAYSFSRQVLGVSVAGAGLSLRESIQSGYAAHESTCRIEGLGGCSIVFEKGGRVLGIQTVARRANLQPGVLALAVSGGSLIQELARLDELGSSDISLITEAAREGIRRWQRS